MDTVRALLMAGTAGIIALALPGACVLTDPEETRSRAACTTGCRALAACGATLDDAALDGCREDCVAELLRGAEEPCFDEELASRECRYGQLVTNGCDRDAALAACADEIHELAACLDDATPPDDEGPDAGGGEGLGLCAGYAGVDPCCADDDPCLRGADGTCDCGGFCAWDAADCGLPGTDPGDTDPTTDAPDCPLNSGYPCSCDVPYCNDGSMCGQIAELSSVLGYCSADCAESQECPPTPFAATSACVVARYDSASSEPTNCALLCDSDADCPPDQRCRATEDGSVCHPPATTGAPHDE